MSDQTGLQNPYAPPTATVADVPATGAVKSSRRARLGAILLDVLIGTLASAPAFAVNFGAMVEAAKTGGSNPFAMYGALYSGVGGLLSVLLLLVMVGVITLLVHRNGQTIGKKIVGIKVVRTNGERATLGRIFWLRYLIPTVISIVPLIGAVFALVDSLMILGAEKRCLHDMMADTIVIRA